MCVCSMPRANLLQVVSVRSLLKAKILSADLQGLQAFPIQKIVATKWHKIYRQLSGLKKWVLFNNGCLFSHTSMISIVS